MIIVLLLQVMEGGGVRRLGGQGVDIIFFLFFFCFCAVVNCCFMAGT